MCMLMSTICVAYGLNGQYIVSLIDMDKQIINWDFCLFRGSKNGTASFIYYKGIIFVCVLSTVISTSLRQSKHCFFLF